MQAEHEVRTWNVALDLGNWSLVALQRYVALDQLDAVVLSHLHPDHCADLTGFYVVRTYHPEGAMPPIPVHAPAGAAERLRAGAVKWQTPVRCAEAFWCAPWVGWENGPAEVCALYFSGYRC